jgi:hypothetical protein
MRRLVDGASIKEAAMSGGERDVIDYVDDETQDEDDTLFLPMRPNNASTGWGGFLGGALAGVAAGSLAPIAPWLAGLLVFAGYGVAAYALGGSRNRLARALSFGFGVMAAAGAAMALGGVFFPAATWSVISAIAERHAVFLSVAILPWPIGFVRYLSLLLLSR